LDRDLKTENEMREREQGVIRTFRRERNQNKSPRGVGFPLPAKKTVNRGVIYCNKLRKNNWERKRKRLTAHHKDNRDARGGHSPTHREKIKKERHRLRLRRYHGFYLSDGPNLG